MGLLLGGHVPQPAGAIPAGPIFLRAVSPWVIAQSDSTGELLGAPSGRQVGDNLFAFLASGTTPSAGAPGWSDLNGATELSMPNISLFQRIATGDANDNITINAAGTGDNLVLAQMASFGAASPLLVLDQGGATNDVVQTAFDLPGVDSNPAFGDTLCVVFGVKDHGVSTVDVPPVMSVDDASGLNTIGNMATSHDETGNMSSSLFWATWNYISSSDGQDILAGAWTYTPATFCRTTSQGLLFWLG